jgi:superfamily II helicase
MVGISEITGLMSSLKAAKDIAETMIGLRDTAAFQAKAIEFQAKILDSMSRAITAQEERAALLEKVRDLETQIARFEAWETEKERYELKDAGNGTLAYALKSALGNAESSHWACPHCYQDRKISILQPETRSVGRTEHLVCNRCSTDLLIQGIRWAPPGGRR